MTTEATTARIETFDADQPITIDLQVASGDIFVRTHDEASVVVRITSNRPDAAARIDEIIVNFDDARHTLEVREPKRRSGEDTRESLLDLTRRVLAMNFHGASLNYVILVPAASSLDVRTGSSDIVAVGVYSNVSVKGASSDLLIDDVADLSVIVASGDVLVQSVRERMTVRSASGDLQVNSLSGSAVANTVSGDVSIGVTSPSDLKVRAVSGDITMYVSPGLRVDIDAKATSGDVRSDIALDDSGAATSDDHGQVVLNASSISGDITLKRLSEKRERKNAVLADLLRDRWEQAGR